MESNQQMAESNFFENLINVFFSPRKTMESVDRNPKWVLPLAVLLALTLIFTILTINVTMTEQMHKQRQVLEKRGMSDEEIDNAIQVGQKVGKIIAPISAIVVVAIFTALIALFIWFVGNIILGGYATYKKVFTILIYSSFISAIGMLIKIPLILQKKTSDITFSLASFFNPENMNKYLYSFLKTIEVFEVWRFVVLAIGFAVVYRFSMKKSAWTMVVLFLLYSALMTIVNALQMGS